jgi:hypothetical protein
MILRISDAPPRLTIQCNACPRRGSYSRARAIAELGDLSLPDFLAAKVSPVCSRYRDRTNFGGCGARFANDSIVRSANSKLD